MSANLEKNQRAFTNSIFCIGNFLSHADDPELLEGKVYIRQERILKMLMKVAWMLPLTLQ